MPYDVSIITVKPNTHNKALPGVEGWLKANPRKGEFIGCLASEIGDLNKIMLLHHYTSEADLAADRDSVARDRNPFGCLPLIDGMSTNTFVQFPFLPAIKPGQYGPIFEIRTYLLKPNGLPPTIAAWEKSAPARQKLSPILAATPIVARQACFRPVTEDGLPLIGEVPGVDGAYVATGHNVWGMLNAPATGEAMAELILDGAARHVDLAPFALDRLPTLDPARLQQRLASRGRV